MNMSFSLTTAQVRAKTKTHTLRTRWRWLKGGEILMAVEKGMGLKKGEKVVKLGQIRVTKVTWKRLNTITQEQVIREGFPEMTPKQFIEFFCKHMGVHPRKRVNFIEFDYV